MVTVDIFRKDEKFVKVKSTGHADHGSYGNDVVCSAIRLTKWDWNDSGGYFDEIIGIRSGINTKRKYKTLEN